MMDSYAFSGETRGRLRIQFKDKDDNPASVGDYIDVPRSLFIAFEATHSPDSFISQQLKPFFKWQPAVDQKAELHSDEGVGCGCIDGKDGGSKWV